MSDDKVEMEQKKPRVSTTKTDYQQKTYSPDDADPSHSSWSENKCCLNLNSSACCKLLTYFINDISNFPDTKLSHSGIIILGNIFLLLTFYVVMTSQNMINQLLLAFTGTALVSCGIANMATDILIQESGRGTVFKRPGNNFKDDRKEGVPAVLALYYYEDQNLFENHSSQNYTKNLDKTLNMELSLRREKKDNLANKDKKVKVRRLQRSSSFSISRKEPAHYSLSDPVKGSGPIVKCSSPGNFRPRLAGISRNARRSSTVRFEKKRLRHAIQSDEPNLT